MLELEDSPILQEMARRLYEVEKYESEELIETQRELSEANDRIDELESVEYELENSKDRVAELEEFIEEHNLQVPK